METNPPQPPPDFRVQSRHPRRNFYVGLTSAVLVVVLGMLTLAAVRVVKRAGSVMERPTKALSSFADDLVRGDYQSAYAEASPGLRADLSLGDMTAYFRERTDKLGALQSVKQDNWQFATKNDVKTAKIYATLQFARGRSKFEFILREEDGVWRVLSYQQLSTGEVDG